MEYLLIPLGALLYRIRGGLTPKLTFDRTGVGRAYCAIGLALPALLIAHPINVLLFAVSLFGALTLGHGAYTDLNRYKDGHNDEPDSWDWLLGPQKKEHSATRNYIREATALVLDGTTHGIAFLAIGNPYGLLLGIGKYLAFETGHQIHERFPNLKFPKGIQPAHEVGEALFGAMLGLVVALSFN